MNEPKDLLELLGLEQSEIESETELDYEAYEDFLKKLRGEG